MRSAEGAGVSGEAVARDAGGALSGEVDTVGAGRLADATGSILVNEVLADRIAGSTAVDAEAVIRSRRIALDALALVTRETLSAVGSAAAAS